MGDRAPTFRPMGQLAARCGHYCWLEHRLFTLTGSWAGAPAVVTAAPGPPGAWDAEVRVVCSEMSSWHAFAAASWHDRLPVRAGVDADALVVAPSGSVAQALDLLAAEAEEDLVDAFGGLVGQILPALLAAYDDDFADGSAVSEAPVRALLDLVRPRVHQEIDQGAVLLGRARRDDSWAARGARTDGDGGVERGREGVDLAGRLQRVLGGEKRHLPCCTGILTRPLQCFCSPCAPKATQAA